MTHATIAENIISMLPRLHAEIFLSMIETEKLDTLVKNMHKMDKINMKQEREREIQINGISKIEWKIQWQR